MGCIYKITNKVNGKVYIGQTIYTAYERFKNHKYDSKKKNYGVYNMHLHKAIRKYGADAFLVEEIEACANDLLDEREKFWIEHYDSVKSGYNTSYGGEGVTRYSDSQLLEQWNSGKNLGRISESIGISRRKASLRLLSLGVSKEEIQKRRYLYSAKNRGRPVYQYGLDGKFIKEYPSLQSAEDEYKCSSIGDAVLGIAHTSCEYQWRSYRVDQIEPYYNENTGTSKPVYQYSLDGKYFGSFESAAEAARSVGKDVSNLCDVCNGKQRSCGGYLWSYEFHESIAPMRQKKLSRKKIAKYSVEGEFVESYDSLTIASKENGIGTPSLSNVCRGKRKTAGGFIWRYLEENGGN